MSLPRDLPSKERLREILMFDPETGLLIWLPRKVPDGLTAPQSRGIKGWNAKWAGTPALNCVHAHGYRGGMVFRRRVYAHRVIWKLVTGEEPRQIDHINGDRSDNRWENLREVSASENSRNLGVRSVNTSGVLGVYFSKKDKCWVAQIKENGKVQHLGHFASKDDAIHTRREAERERGFHPNHGRRSA